MARWTARRAAVPALVAPQVLEVLWVLISALLRIIHDEITNASRVIVDHGSVIVQSTMILQLVHELLCELLPSRLAPCVFTKVLDRGTLRDMFGRMLWMDVVEYWIRICQAHWSVGIFERGYWVFDNLEILIEANDITDAVSIRIGP